MSKYQKIDARKEDSAKSDKGRKISKTAYKSLLIPLYLLLIIAIIMIVVQRSNEDTWVQDKNGNWVKHGNPTIQDFDSCAKKYPVIETYPEQCTIPNGPTFTKDDIHLKY